MFNLGFNSEKPKMEGPGYIVLNIIRVLNIIVLLTVVIASWIMLVRTVQTSNFFFFDATTHFIASTIGIFLIISEATLFKSYFARYWPLLSENSGFVFLGLTMIALGFNTLGNLNKVATSVDNLGLPLWREVIAGGILSALLGLFNIIAGYVFCDSANGVTSRQVRSYGAVVPKDTLTKSSGSFTSKVSGSSRRPASLVLPSYHENADNRRKSKFGFNFPIRTSKIEISRPVATDPEQFKKWESRSSPIAPELQRPPTALHPAYSPSRYSVASRF